MKHINLVMIAAGCACLLAGGCNFGGKELQEARRIASEAREQYAEASRKGNASATLRLAYEYQSDSPLLISDVNRSMVKFGKLLEKAGRQNPELTHRFLDVFYHPRYLSAGDLLKEARTQDWVCNRSMVRVCGHRLPTREHRAKTGAVMKTAQVIFTGESKEDYFDGWEIPLVVAEGVYRTQINCRFVRDGACTIIGSELDALRANFESYDEVMVIGEFCRDESGTYIRNPIIVNEVFDASKQVDF